MPFVKSCIRSRVDRRKLESSRERALSGVIGSVRRSRSWALGLAAVFLAMNIKGHAGIFGCEASLFSFRPQRLVRRG